MSVTPANIAVALGVTAPDPGSPLEQQWALWISDAEMLIENRRELLNADSPPAASRDYVVRQAVVEHVRKPDDATTVTIAVDDGSSTRRYESSKGRVAILDEWWDELGLALPAEGSFTIRPAGRKPDAVIT